MKKILLFIVALVATLSMNAQTTEIYEGTTLKKAYYGADVMVSFGENSITVKQGAVKDTYEGPDYKVVSKELPPPPAGSTGKAKRTGNIDVNWVQLWKGGPKFATYNVGAKDSTQYGFFSPWSDDIAESNWGSNWHMPTKDELQALIDKCDVQWTDNYNGTDMAGRIYTGKGDYASNSIFLPAAGYSSDYTVYGNGTGGNYWSSTPNATDYAFDLYFSSSGQGVGYDRSDYGYSVRAVYFEPTTGTAKRTGDIDVKWVQLWKDGPKFAEYNVGASSATDVGSMKKFADAIKEGDDYVWGSNWCTPSKDKLEELLKAAQGDSSAKVKCEYTQENGVWGFKFTGKETGYDQNSVFFPAQNGKSSYGGAGYWSGTVSGSNVSYMTLGYNDGEWTSAWYRTDQTSNHLVRPVLAK